MRSLGSLGSARCWPLPSRSPRLTPPSLRPFLRHVERMGRYEQYKPGHAEHCDQQLSLEPHVLSNPSAHVMGQHLPVQHHVNHGRCHKDQGSGVVHGHEQVAPPGGPVVQGKMEGDAGRNQPRSCTEQSERCQCSGAEPSLSRNLLTHFSGPPRFPRCRPNNCYTVCMKLQRQTVSVRIRQLNSLAFMLDKIFISIE